MSKTDVDVVVPWVWAMRTVLALAACWTDGVPSITADAVSNNKSNPPVPSWVTSNSKFIWIDGMDVKDRVVGVASIILLTWDDDSLMFSVIVEVVTVPKSLIGRVAGRVIPPPLPDPMSERFLVDPPVKTTISGPKVLISPVTVGSIAESLMSSDSLIVRI